MKKNKILCKCCECGNEFEVIFSRQKLAKYCSKRCYHKSRENELPWNYGKSYDDVYGIDKSNEIKNKISKKVIGEKNPMYGKHHSMKAKKLMADAKNGYIPWNKGKKFPGMFSDVNRVGKNNAYVKHILKEEAITYEEYLSSMDEYDRYKKMVRNITNLQPIHLLENYEKRGTSYNDEFAYHLDHIYPISKGFKNKIPPEVIGDISNLRFIHWKDNLYKADKI